MKRKIIHFWTHTMEDQSGQALIMMAIMMVAFIGFAGMVVDVGDLYYSYHELKTSTNAAAMAGAEGLSTSGAKALSNAALYSSQEGGKNHYGNLNVTVYNARLGCVTSAVGAIVPCVNTGSSSKANAIQVTQTAVVRTYFMAVFGKPSVKIQATSSALMRGSTSTPYNIAIVIDATGSMNTKDYNCPKTVSYGKYHYTTYLSRLECAEQGIQTFLQSISPCAESGCGTISSGSYANSVDEVAIFAFPPPSNSTQAAKDYTCSSGGYGWNGGYSSAPTVGPYNFPSSTASSYNPGTGPTYQITPFMSNYQTLNSSGIPTGDLNTSSSSYVSLAVGTQSGCGITGNGSTYYAGAIYAAQSALLQEQAARAAQGVQTQNALIITSDGDANATPPDKYGYGGKYPNQYRCTDWQGDNYCMSTTGLNANGVGIYPSGVNDCAQAVAAAKAATAQGTKVFTVAYGSPTTGCDTDTASGGIRSPCSTIQQMASELSLFYADNNQSGVNSNCYSPNSASDLASIFTNIAGQLTNARLIPNSAWPTS